jgi:hypothetical protein
LLPVLSLFHDALTIVKTKHAEYTYFLYFMGQGERFFETIEERLVTLFERITRRLN